MSLYLKFTPEETEEFPSSALQISENDEATIEFLVYETHQSRDRQSVLFYADDAQERQIYEWFKARAERKGWL